LKYWILDHKLKRTIEYQTLIKTIGCAVLLDSALKITVLGNPLRRGLFGKRSRHGMLVELAQHEGDIWHVENYSDSVMRGAISPTPKDESLLLNPPLSSA
jgi:hypothetical protein